MYKQERKAGFPQFLLCLVAAVFVWIICDIVGLLIKNALISDVLFVVAACIFVYCVYVHYCASFSYEFTKNKLVITPSHIIFENGRCYNKDGRHRTISTYYLNKNENIPVIVELKLK